MSGFKELRVPEQESNCSVHGGQWFVFVNDNYGSRYANDGYHFLHKDGKRLCKLRSDIENGRLMFDTQLKAFEKSIEFYTLHCERYPWISEYKNCSGAVALPVGGGVISETMGFD